MGERLNLEGAATVRRSLAARASQMEKRIGEQKYADKQEVMRAWIKKAREIQRRLHVAPSPSLILEAFEHIDAQPRL